MLGTYFGENWSLMPSDWVSSAGGAWNRGTVKPATFHLGLAQLSHVGLQEHQTLGITKISETRGFQVSSILRNIRLPHTHICCHEK